LAAFQAVLTSAHNLHTIADEQRWLQEATLCALVNVCIKFRFFL
jgi:hypothetical protein